MIFNDTKHFYINCDNTKKGLFLFRFTNKLSLSNQTLIFLIYFLHPELLMNNNWKNHSSAIHFSSKMESLNCPNEGYALSPAVETNSILHIDPPKI